MDNNEEMAKQQVVEEASHQVEISAKRRNKKKIKATIYLTEEAEQAFTELYIHRLKLFMKENACKNNLPHHEDHFSFEIM